MKKSFRICLAALTFSLAASGADTTYDTIVKVKAWRTHFDIQLSSATHSCGGGPASHFRVEPTDSELIRLATGVWLSGRQVDLNYECDTINGMTTAWVKGVRAQ